ncbi:MAG: response regulator [Nitrospirae bacterium]|nr:response regulator [Nitrospirota bacterium]
MTYPLQKKDTSILYVEDEELLRKNLISFLHRRFGVVYSAANGMEGLELFTKHLPDIVITDILMPVMDGLEMVKRIKQLQPDIPIIITTAFSDTQYLMQAISLKVDGYVTKPIDYNDLLDAINRIIHFLTSKTLEISYTESLKRIQRMLSGAIDALAYAIESRDPYTAGHQKRVARLAGAICVQMGCTEEEVRKIEIVGVIHDIGKISIPAEMLMKPYDLQDAEMSLLHNHCKVGFDILKNIEFPFPVAEIVYQHHERLDGSGYPRGLMKNDIIFEARIISVADVVESMYSHRPYRPSCGIDKAIEEILTHRETLYDAEVVDACAALFKRGYTLDAKI